MVETVVKISCDYCGYFDETAKNKIDLKGKRIRVGEITFRKRSEKYGWLSVLNGNGTIEDFCGKECYNLHKQEQSKP